MLPNIRTLLNNLLKKKNNFSLVAAKYTKRGLMLGLATFALLTHSVDLKAKVVARVPEIPEYDLQCDAVFSCPLVIDRRVDFWINVFHQWKKENRVLHDSRQPERVYMVLDTKDQCRRKNPKGEVRKGLEEVRKRLDGLAKLMAQGVDVKRLQKHPYYKLFPSASIDYVKEARNSIRCQSGNREMFEQALQNFQEYRPYIVNALIAQNLPLDIQYLPFVESSYNPKAYSFAGAAGMWQIMPRTARSLGLQVGSSIDERFEPEFATLAAAKYFRESIDRLSKTAKEGQHSTLPKDINPFVITSYNYGVRGMQRAIIQVGTDYERLLREYKSASFQIAVRNFYASFLAARHVAQNQATFFPNLSYKEQTVAVNRIAVPKPLLAKQLLVVLNVPKKQLQKLNPGITNRVWKNQRAVPTGFILKVPFKSEGWEKESNRLKQLKGVSTGRGYSGRKHKVRKGQTACGIARRYKVRCKDLISLNKLNRKAVVKIGQRLKIPGGVQKYRLTSIVKSSQELRTKLALQQTQIAQQSIVSNGSEINNATVDTAQALSLEKTPVISTPETIDMSNEVMQGTPASNNALKTSIATTSNGAQKELPPKIIGQEKSVEQSSALDSKSTGNISTSSSSGDKKDDSLAELNQLVNLNTAIVERGNRRWVNVLPSESLGLYADWLGVGTTSQLRRLNKLGGKAVIDVFQRVYLPSMTNQQRRNFKLSRNEYHLNLQLQYFERFEIVSVKKRNVKKNETMWSIAKNNRIPMWLIMQYNKQVKRDKPVRIPIVKLKKT